MLMNFTSFGRKYGLHYGSSIVATSRSSYSSWTLLRHQYSVVLKSDHLLYTRE